MSNQFNLDRVAQQFDQLKRDMPVLIANQAQNFFVDSWKKQGWTNNSTEAWKPRKKETKKTQGKKILVSSGTLRRAVNNSIRVQTFDKVMLQVDASAVPYAGIHNEGGTITMRNGAKIVMPKRQFMGDSATLRGMQTKLIKKEIDKVWQG